MKRDEANQVTIIIATLPGSYMKEWINQIIDYIDYGYHVTIVTPPGYSRDTLGKLMTHSPPLRLLTSDKQGQVAQRAYGLKRVETDFAMQMDDDVILDKHDILRLVQQLKKLGKRCCIAPKLAQFPSGEELQSHPDWKTGKGIIRYFLAVVVYGVRRLRVSRLYGTTTRSGHGYGVPSRLELSNPLEVEWLPGGCMLYRKEDAIVDDFYPFTGKAYAEDLIYSYLHKKRGTRLYCSNDVIALTPLSMPIRNAEIALSLPKDHKARLAYVKMSSGSIVHLYLSHVWVMLSEVFSFISQKLRRIIHGRA